MAKKIKTILDLQSNKIVNVAAGTNPADAVNFLQLQNAIAGGSEYIGGYNAATNTPDLTAADGSVLKGYQYTVAVAGTFAGQNVEVGDFIISEKDDPTADGDFTVLNRNVDPVAAASETAPGIVELATQAEVNAGTDTIRAVTPATLVSYVSNQSQATPQATETTAGKAEIATQAETNAGTDDSRIVTPLKLKTILEDNETPDASTTEKGVIEIATQTEVDAGTDIERAITPATLAGRLANFPKKERYNLNLGDSQGLVVLNHTIGNKFFSVTVQKGDTGEEYEVEVSRKTATTLELSATGPDILMSVILIG